MSLAQILGVPKALIGMVHLGPLPGSPRWGGSMGEVNPVDPERVKRLVEAAHGAAVRAERRRRGG